MCADQRIPIVLVHGIARFDILHELLKKELALPDNEIQDRLEYFKGIKTHLESNGFKVFHTNQDFAGSVDLRARQLKERVNEILAEQGVDQVHVITHSMGALDARHMIVDHGMADQVRSLTTIAGPHLGTMIADHILDGKTGTFLKKILEQIINVDGVEDLRVTACEQFNARAEDEEARNAVFYQTYASSEELKLVFLPLMPSWNVIHDQKGSNDGLVDVQSQHWKKILVAKDGTQKQIAQKDFPFPADHLNEIGWWDPLEAQNPAFASTSLFKRKDIYEDKVKAVYLDIARNLP
jgi:triacylglycerol lipase